jgi:hypothetical protein
MANIPPYMKGQSPESKEIYDARLNKALNCISDNGFVPANQSEATIAALAQTQQNSTVWYDTDNHRWVGKQNGVLVEFQTTPV